MIVFIWLLLLFITGCSVYLSQYGMIYVFGASALKTILVAEYFMNLKESGWIIRTCVAIATLSLAGILYGFLG